MTETPSSRILTAPDALPERLRPSFDDPRQGARFRAPWDAPPVASTRDILRWKLGQKNPWASEKRRALAPPVVSHALDKMHDLDAPTRALHNGHASFYLILDEVRIWIDPVFGPALLVPRQTASAVDPARPPGADLVLLTHGHFDHLDTRSLKAVAAASPGATYLVPLGLGRYLPKVCAPVIEVGWWTQLVLRGLTLTFTPSQHWHKRTATDTNAALWGGWHVQGSHSVYHTGDSGYFGGFEAVRYTLGAPDLALMPLGAYEPRWFMAPQHMDPDHTLQSWRDLGARHMVPMHWGTFDLSDEPLTQGLALFDALLDARAPELRPNYLPLAHGEALGLRGDQLVRSSR